MLRCHVTARKGQKPITCHKPAKDHKPATDFDQKKRVPDKRKHKVAVRTRISLSGADE